MKNYGGAIKRPRGKDAWNNAIIVPDSWRFGMEGVWLVLTIGYLGVNIFGQFLMGGSCALIFPLEFSIMPNYYRK